jgi:hypothetical protein
METLTNEQIWDELAKASFAVVSYTTPAGEPRSSGVVYALTDHRMYVVVAVDSWKARHIAVNGKVSVTVPVRRGGLMSLVFPIPPETISFSGSAVVHEGRAVPEALTRLVPPERLEHCRVIEIRPEGHFVTYGVGVPLLRMRVPERARGRVPIT